MDKAIEELISNEITQAYAAKNIAPYLDVTVPEAPPEWNQIIRNWAISDVIFGGIEKLHYAYLFLFDRKAYKEKKEYMEQENKTREGLHQARERSDAEFEEELRAFGIKTGQEKDAYMVAHFAGSAMARFVYRANESKDGVEVVKRKNGVAEEIKLAPELFEDYLAISVNDGIRCLIEKYWIPIRGVEMPQIVNPDFEEKAVAWLTKEAYSKIGQGNECAFLEMVVIKQEDEKIDLKLFFPKL